jgi:hypothetical protein
MGTQRAEVAMIADVDEIMAMLRGVQRYAEQDILNKYVPTTTGELREVRHAIWRARERLRLEDGIVFGSLPGWPGTFHRLDWSQTERQANRQRARGTRAHRRAEEKLRLASTQAPDQSKERLSEAADRIALRVAMRAAKG